MAIATIKARIRQMIRRSFKVFILVYGKHKTQGGSRSSFLNRPATFKREITPLVRIGTTEPAL
jgi:hypothetical protein